MDHIHHRFATQVTKNDYREGAQMRDMIVCDMWTHSVLL